MMDSRSLSSLAIKLFDIEALKFGKFTLKSGISSPVYFDLRVIVSYPDILLEVADWIEHSVNNSVQFDNICGVPYTALPIATCICTKYGFPMLIRRKEAKDYGTKKMIEGHFKQGDHCLVVEDVVTTGSSVLETVQTLKQVGISVTDAVVLLDREQGGRENLAAHGIKLHSVCGLSKLMTLLKEAGKVGEDVVQSVQQFITENSSVEKTSAPEPMSDRHMSYLERSSQCSHPVSKRLLDVMAIKKTNLCCSADVTTCEELLKLAADVGPHICVLKTHVDILEDFTPAFPEQLKQLAEKYNFLIFEDRKFADIGWTVQQQFTGGIYKISQWADIVNAHAVPGPGVLAALQKAGNGRCGCLLIAEMSSQGSLATGSYAKGAVNIAEEYKDIVMGFICQSRVSKSPDHIHMTPGVKLGGGGDSLGQQYSTPQEAVLQRGCDVIIVGRGITQANSPALAAQQYKEAGYEAYLKHIQTEH